MRIAYKKQFTLNYSTYTKVENNSLVDILKSGDLTTNRWKHFKKKKRG